MSSPFEDRACEDLERLQAERDRLRAALEIAVGSIQAALNKDAAPMSADAHLDEALRVAAAVGVVPSEVYSAAATKLRMEVTK